MELSEVVEVPVAEELSEDVELSDVVLFDGLVGCRLFVVILALAALSALSVELSDVAEPSDDVELSHDELFVELSGMIPFL